METTRSQERKEKQLKELTILEAELKSLKKGARVYRQQPNSDILFLTSKDKELANVTKQLSTLKKS